MFFLNISLNTLEQKKTKNSFGALSLSLKINPFQWLVYIFNQPNNYVIKNHNQF